MGLVGARNRTKMKILKRRPPSIRPIPSPCLAAVAMLAGHSRVMGEGGAAAGGGGQWWSVVL